MLTDIMLLVLLFAFLGLSAEVLVRNVSYLARALQVKLFALGIILGLATSLPETSVGINASLEGLASISVGNLFGGVIVILGLILGASLLFGKAIDTDSRLSLILPQVGIIFIPIILGLDGRFGLFDCLVMILSYFLLVAYLYRSHHSFNPGRLAVLDRNRVVRALFLSLLGIAAILLLSHFIIGLSEQLLAASSLSKLSLGVLVFSLGTNLPEIIIAITSWRRKAAELSLSHLLSSAFTNVLILGVLSVAQPIVFTVGAAYYLISFFLAVILLLFLVFYRSRGRLERFEGGILLACYFLFLGLNFWLLPR